MPQVDKVTFFPQVFWLVLLLIVFYVLFLRTFFTHIVNTFRVRSFFYLQNAENKYRNQVNVVNQNSELTFMMQSLLSVTLLEGKQGLLKDAKNWSNSSIEQQLNDSAFISTVFDSKITMLLEEDELLESCNY
jgi:hypothetical protein